MRKTYKISAGIIPVFSSDSGYLLLLLRAYNYWDFPKGLVETGEESLAAALRELTEETTLKDPAFPWGITHIDTAPYGQGKIGRYFIGQVKNQKVSLPVNPEIGRPEHMEFRWVSPDEAKKLLVPRLHSVLEWAKKMMAK